jgi:hypothetical protein
MPARAAATASVVPALHPLCRSLPPDPTSPPRMSPSPELRSSRDRSALGDDRFGETVAVDVGAPG